ncbi:cyclopropane-fatty-acyl-phospholipid synthase [Fontimonas thermophila]|uniref:Cyclopropane-fatty-acyl-phospholipid synthase n=1 Tax=Fontimonas thermophila TaxID=1076937 RepID=A0A1I2ID48_9GAMM|nr:cyclopropane-fatty-acyl-phospholipid synthase family protein [Fontimonas thermophila]SFF39550.1 cyclopropane-fatty-acyl-phospholipid synthase [Fontimonas thermophila]
MPPQPHRERLPIRLSEAGWVPDAILRRAIRGLCRLRLVEEYAGGVGARAERFETRLRQWREGPIALATHEANVQHYEVPARFFEHVLGAQLKYSCALWPEGVTTLDEAEEAMLRLTAERAQLGDGMRILELGCGWGSLSLWMARRYPHARIVGVSNSSTQRAWIERRAAQLGLDNLEIITADINDFAPRGRFDRIVSVEMFEHVRNHAELFRRIRTWLEPDGQVFVHVFCHRELTYPFDARGDSDWMARHFFSGGIMPGYDLFLHYPQDLRVQQRWWIDGTHYARTSEAWLRRLDENRHTIEKIFAEHDPRDAARKVQRWRMFFMAVAELFAYDRGRQWGVGHYLLRP